MSLMSGGPDLPKCDILLGGERERETARVWVRVAVGNMGGGRKGLMN